MIRVHLVSFRLATDTIGAFLRNAGDIEVVGSSCTIAEDIIGTTDSADVMIVDENITQNTLDLVRKVSSLSAQNRILIFGVSPDQELVLRYIEAGIAGYLTSESSAQDLLEAITEVCAGGSWMSEGITAAVVERIHRLSLQRGSMSSHPDVILSERELEVLRLLVSGMTNKMIATELDITVSTVKNHVHNILAKMQVRNRREAIRCAYRKRLLKPSNAP